MSTFDIKKFLINEGMTRVSRDRKRLLKEAEESGETAEIIYRGFTIHKNGNVTVDEYPYEEVESPYNYPSEEAWTWYFDNNPWIMKSSELEYDTPYLVALPEAFGEQVEENAVAELDFKGKVYCFYLESDADELIYRGSDDSEELAKYNAMLKELNEESDKELAIRASRITHADPKGMTNGIRRKSNGSTTAGNWNGMGSANQDTEYRKEQAKQNAKLKKQLGIKTKPMSREDWITKKLNKELGL